MIEGMFDLPDGVAVKYEFYEDDVKLTAKLRCKRRMIDAEFWMSRNDDGAWNRSGQYGSTFTCDGHDVAPAPGYRSREKPLPTGLNDKDIKIAVDTMRDGWRDYIKAHPEIYKEVCRDRLSQRLRFHIGERHALEQLIAKKSRVIQAFEQAIASDHPEDGWKMAHKAMCEVGLADPRFDAP